MAHNPYLAAPIQGTLVQVRHGLPLESPPMFEGFAPSIPTPSAGAIFSLDELYRYVLWRTWAPELPVVAFIGLNPSTATEEVLDPTIRRCLGFAKRWGYGTLYMLNLFAYRATKPADMEAQADPEGPYNNQYLLHVSAMADRVVAAWGAHGSFGDRASAFLDLYTGPYGSVHTDPERTQLVCLGTTMLGEPRHPLYVPNNTEVVPYGNR